jgi:membrane fusion protein (multidrug efflux system)
MKTKTNYFLTLIALALATVSCNKKEEEQEKPQVVKVAVQKIQKVDRVQELDYSATIEADNTAQISFAVPGVVNTVAVKEGQTVKNGQLLASLDATTYSNALQIANLSYEQTLDMYYRLDELYAKGSLPEKDYIDIRTKLAQSAANKRISAKQIKDTRLCAPMSGIITHRFIEKGSAAAPGIPAFSIIKTDMVYAKITVPESEVGIFKQGMVANLFIPTLNDSIKGKISIINPQADDKSKTFTIKIKIDNGNQKLLPGMLAYAKINPMKTEKVIVIPATAVVRDADDITYVYVVNNNKTVVRKRITVGSITGMQEIIIKDGLSESDIIVTAGQSRLKDGALVSF